VWPYTEDARWHLFAFEVDAAAFDKLRADLPAQLLWGTPPIDLPALVRACLPASPVDVGLGAAYEDVGPVARLMYQAIDPFTPEDLMLPTPLVDTTWPVHADVLLWDDELGPVSYATGDGLRDAASRLQRWVDDETDAALAAKIATVADHYRAIGARGGTLITFVARNPRS
jgi:hypothetical protein